VPQAVALLDILLLIQPRSAHCVFCVPGNVVPELEDIKPLRALAA
jgi:hypothetical protein